MASEVLTGRGWPFPLRPGDDGRLRLVGDEEKIRQSIWIILATAPGERQMLPEFGCGVHDLLFGPNSTALRQEAERRVHDALLRWEPRIDVLNVRAETSGGAGSPAGAGTLLLLRIDYRVRDSNAFYNLVYPLYITEGPGA